mmetsp:Transcript_128555/g.320614  ORF Transcript_128555/g.320614 Transcript_128555/m.320614 type:complete len:275 (-) Transcript_128555:479-1303(-)
MGQQAPCCAAPDQEATGEALEETEKFPTSSSPARGGGGGGDSQEECLNDEENQRRMDAMKGRSRRAGVAAEGLSATQVKDYVKPVYPKDEATQQRIQAVIKGSDKMQVLFGHLDASSMVDIVNAFQEVTRKKDEDVIRQGDEGDCLYIISEGAVDVFVARPGAAAAEEGSADGCRLLLDLRLAAGAAAPPSPGGWPRPSGGSCCCWEVDVVEVWPSEPRLPLSAGGAVSNCHIDLDLKSGSAPTTMVSARSVAGGIRESRSLSEALRFCKNFWR